MSGSKNAAAGRASGDVGRAAFFAAYSSSEHGTLVPDSPSPAESGARAADDWPLCSYLELGAFHSAVPCARLHARQHVCGNGIWLNSARLWSSSFQS